MEASTIETISVISSVSSIIIGPIGIFFAVIACIQAAYYYGKSKETEAELKKQLAVMATQNDTIKEITHKMLSSTIKTISNIAQSRERGPANDAGIGQVLEMLNSMREANKTNTSLPGNGDQTIAGHKIPKIPDPMTKENLQTEAISAFGQIFIFAGLANVYSQYILPRRSEFEKRTREDPLLQQHIEVVNMTSNICNEAYQVLGEIRKNIQSVMDQHVLYPMLVDYETRFKNQVRTADAAIDNWERIKSTGSDE